MVWCGASITEEKEGRTLSGMDASISLFWLIVGGYITGAESRREKEEELRLKADKVVAALDRKNTRIQLYLHRLIVRGTRTVYLCNILILLFPRAQPTPLRGISPYPLFSTRKRDPSLSSGLPENYTQ